MKSQQIDFRVTGIAPLLMHNVQLADPTAEITKAIKAVSGKRKKTDSDLEDLARLEWSGSLYVQKNRVILPGKWIIAALIEGAKKSRMGKQFEYGVFVDDAYELDFPDKDKPIKSLYDSGNGYVFKEIVRVKTDRILRCRPKFDTWGADIRVYYYPDTVNRDSVISAFEIAGYSSGLGDWRPRFGRFTVEAK